ncbi:MAG: J domain-containing protein [Baekduia sp.]
MARDPYLTLGVDRKASADEIKKAYRKLARELHPDRNPGDKGAEDRFKEVQAAYDIVGDPEKRKQHDRGGSFSNPFAGAGAGAADFGGSFSDILSNLFDRGGDPGQAAGARQRRPAGPIPERGDDLEAAARLTFDQAITGTQLPLSVPTTQTCTTCRGTGSKPGTMPKTCPKCQGSGIDSQGQGLFSISHPCSRCHGRGTVIEHPCASCQGDGVQRTVKQYKVNIPAGVKEGSRVRLPGKGAAGRNGGPNGDLYVTCHVADSPIFVRKGDHLEVEVPLTIPEAIRGADVEVPTLNGRKKLRVPPGTRHGTVQRLRGEGPPRLGAGSARGDIHYRFVIDVPATLSAEQSDAVEQLAGVLDADPRARLFS